jgi:hypothetical protein
MVEQSLVAATLVEIALKVLAVAIVTLAGLVIWLAAKGRARLRSIRVRREWERDS